MAFRARIAQHIEIHRESRFPSLSPSVENRATRFDPRNHPSLFLSPTPRGESATYLNLSSSSLLPPRSVLFYSRGTSAFASAATPFNLAPGPIPLCPYLIRLSRERSIRTHVFFPFLSPPPPLPPSRPLDRCACFCISRNTGIYGRPHAGVSITLALVIAKFRPLHLYPVCLSRT